MRLIDYLIETSGDDKQAKIKAVRAKLAQAEADLKDMSVTPYSEEAADAIDDARADVAKLKAELASLTEGIVRKPFETKQDFEARKRRAQERDKQSSDSVLQREQTHGEEYHYGATKVRKLPIAKESVGYTATEAYQRHTEEAQKNLQQISQLLQAHAQHQSSNSASWGHTGDIAHVNELLKEVVDFLTGEPE